MVASSNSSRETFRLNWNHVQRINQLSETNNHDIASPLEGMTLRSDQIQGGSGFAPATVADLGFEPTDGATHTATGGGVSGGKRARATPNPIRRSHAEPY